MEVMGNTLFALEGNVIKGIDLDTEMKVMELTIPGALFLNGITNNGSDILWVTDFSGSSIYQINVADLSNPSVEEFVSNTLATPNGIIYDGDNNRLLYVAWGSNAAVRAVDLSTKQISLVANTGPGNIDGIARDAQGQYYLSSWTPDVITLYDADFANAPTTLMTPSLDSPADIGIAITPGILAIPMGGSIIFVDLEQDATAISEAPELGIRLAIHGNPISEQSVLKYELEQSTSLSLNLYNQQGQKVKTLYEGQQNAGNHWLSLAGMNLASGSYYLRLETAKGILTQSLLITSPDFR